jgi:PLP dependent protein
MKGLDLADEGLAARFGNVRARIKEAALKCHRLPEEITLIAIGKTHPPNLIGDLLGLGATDIGENRVQEAEEKILQVGRNRARWHLVGHLQANKARRALKLFDVIHSLDSIDLARRLDRLCIDEGREKVEILIQVNFTREDTKSGIEEAAVPQLVQALEGLPRIKLIGLMSLPPFFENPEQTRPFFRRLRELRDDVAMKGVFGREPGELSMGMTHDFEVAIEEGATMVRIGTAIFGEREHRL